jgi:hypothetical protein
MAHYEQDIILAGNICGDLFHIVRVSLVVLLLYFDGLRVDRQILFWRIRYSVKEFFEFVLAPRLSYYLDLISIRPTKKIGYPRPDHQSEDGPYRGAKHPSAERPPQEPQENPRPLNHIGAVRNLPLQSLPAAAMVRFGGCSNQPICTLQQW